MEYEEYLLFTKEDLISQLISCKKRCEALEKKNLEYAGRINIESKNYKIYLQEEKYE